MSRKACCYDNAAKESFFATLKTECFQNQLPRNRAEAQAMLFDYIENPLESDTPSLGAGIPFTSRILTCLASRTISSKLTISCPRFRRQIGALCRDGSDSEAKKILTVQKELLFVRLPW
jgi:hypothetical protein